MDNAFPRRASASRLGVLLIAGLASVALFGSSQAFAQQQEVQPEVAMAKMQAIIPPMAETMCGTFLDYFADPAVAEKQAAHSQNSYDALLARGFAKEDALAIVVGHGKSLFSFSGGQ